MSVSPEPSSEVFDESGAFRYDVAIRALYEVTEENRDKLLDELLPHIQHLNH